MILSTIGALTCVLSALYLLVGIIRAFQYKDWHEAYIWGLYVLIDIEDGRYEGL